MAIDTTHLARLAGITLVEKQIVKIIPYNRREIRSFEIWETAVSHTTLTEQAGIVKSSVGDMQYGEYDKDARQGWIRDDNEHDRDEEEVDRYSPDDSVDTKATKADCVVKLRQLDDLHRQCSSEVDELLDHYKKRGDFGSRESSEVDCILDCYKKMYASLFSSH